MFKYYYWDMRNIPLNSDKDNEFKNYFKENRNSFLLLDDNIYIDTIALGTNFSCCEDCCDCKIELEGINPNDIFNQPDRLINLSGYCCDGGCVISKDLISTINDLIDNEGLCSYLQDDAVAFINTLGFYDSFVVGNKVYFKTNTMNGRCIFSSYKNCHKYCALHSFALDKGFNVFEVKPFDCSLFPLDIIVCDGVYYITAVTSQNSYCRFNESNKPINLTCINNNKHNTPLYKFCRELIIDIFGEMVYDIIDAYFIEKERGFV